MRKSLLIFIVLLSLLPALGEGAAEGDLTKVGQLAPDFLVTTLDGRKFKLSQMKGKVVLLNFFATWCGPCLTELPHLETDIVKGMKSPRLEVLVVGREHNNQELKEFRKSNGFTFPIAGDPDRRVYGLYAEKYIPRTYLIDRHGRIQYQTKGYSDQDWEELKAKLSELLK